MNHPRMQSAVIFPENFQEELRGVIQNFPADRLFVLTETNTERLCWPVLSQMAELATAPRLVIGAGEQSKNSTSLLQVWEFLSREGADRKSLLINLGGGMLTDLGGFAASTFKRGISFVNIPTTLLSQVDASIGGKTGINLGGLKNEAGTFASPLTIFIDSLFLKTLDNENFLSGYAEMIKHGLIKDVNHLEGLKCYNLDKGALKKLIARSVAIKEYFVLNDPTEQHIRKALNFGHTIGHAFESYAMQKRKPILHGFAVAYGMICELYLSFLKLELDGAVVREISQWLISLYGKFEITPTDFEPLYLLMTRDKKNEGQRINFTLLSEIGHVEIDANCDKKMIFEALDFYRSLDK